MMSKFLVLIWFIFTANFSSSGQSLAALDQLNGFKKFKFGSSVSSIPYLKRIVLSAHLEGVSTYSYIGHDIQYFYGVAIDEILLTFYKNKLYQIGVDFGNPSKEYEPSEFELVQTNLAANFGNDFQAVSPSEQGEVLNGSIWDGNKVRLENIRVYFPPTLEWQKDPKYKHITGYILFTNKEIQRQQQASELN